MDQASFLEALSAGQWNFSRTRFLGPIHYSKETLPPSSRVNIASKLCFDSAVFEDDFSFYDFAGDIFSFPNVTAHGKFALNHINVSHLVGKNSVFKKWVTISNTHVGVTVSFVQSTFKGGILLRHITGRPALELNAVHSAKTVIIGRDGFSKISTEVSLYLVT